MSKWKCLPVALLVVLFALPLAPAAPLEPNRQWKGSVDDVALMKLAPKGGAILTAKEFEALWKAWKVAGKQPEVDFTKELVGVTTSRGSSLSLTANLDDGKLTVGGFGTRDLRPGFRYVIATFPKAGVKTVNGKAIE